MSGDATYFPKRRMDCDVVAREEILEKYLLGRLDEETREAFESHYLECSRCFEELRALREIRAELRRVGAQIPREATRPYRRWASAGALAAAVVMAVALLLWMRPTAPSTSPDTTTSPSPPQAQAPEPLPSKQPAASAPSLEQLARVEPPRYEPLTFRGIPDEATERFRRGMEHYRKADYRAALQDLRAAGELDPDAAHIRFFRGICHLMLGQNAGAVETLRGTIALGETPYLEDAHFYLAKAFLRQGNVGAAETQLKEVVRLQGASSNEATRMLNQLARIKAR